MVLVINTVEQALRLGLISQATIDKYGEDKVKAFIEADANQYVESQIVAENENDFTLDDDSDWYFLNRYIFK
jgi:hypothetical protein